MYGFDTKYAMHVLRLGFQGVELLTTGRLSLPMQEPERSFLLDVRRGKVSEDECLARAGDLEQQLTDLTTTSPLPAEPDDARVEDWMLSACRRRWGVAVVDAGLRAKEAERQRFVELADRLRSSSDPDEVREIRNELTRMTFGA